jgi:hypothetical protein
MNRIFYLVMLVLPAIFFNIGNNYFSSKNLLLNSSMTSNPTENIKKQEYSLIYLNSYLTAARDDRIEDCLRSGNCKD